MRIRLSFGLLVLPFGTVTGYCGVTLPRLLALDGMSTGAIAGFLALAMQPHSFKFLLELTLDARFRKRSWFIGAVCVAASMLALAIVLAIDLEESLRFGAMCHCSSRCCSSRTRQRRSRRVRCTR